MGFRSRARRLSLYALGVMACACGEVGFDRPGNSDAAADGSATDSLVPRDSASDRVLPGDAARDAVVGMDADIPDARNDAGAGTCSDGVQNQGELFVDSGGPCSHRAPRCGEGADPWTLGLFTFENVSATMVNDETGAGNGTIQSGPASYDTSASGCGMAWEGTGGAWLVVPNVAGWKQPMGAIDFWLRVPDMSAETTAQVPLSRDASGNGNGHIVIAVNPDQRVVIRFQNTAGDIYRCSDVLTAGNWVHVGVNVGAPDLALYVDGSEANFVGSAPFAGTATSVNCSTDTLAVGFDGNDEPWVIGANQWTSTPGTSDTTVHYLKASAAIDHVRISSVRRDFTR